MSTKGEHSELNEPNQLTEKPMDKQQSPPRNFKPNNNRHIVTFGIVTLLFTLYITAAAIRHSNYSHKDDIKDDTDMERKNQDILRKKEIQRQSMILEKLQEHEHICSELEIFIKELKWSDRINDDSRVDAIIVEKTNSKLHKIKNAQSKANDEDTKDTATEDTKNDTVQLEISKKNLEEQKKDQVKKRNSTAEPIIYLFALVFIYLLLKAASDINQHYKSQAKGDKRLRRCSLQSYAQTHKQDRRASKDKPLNTINQRHQFLEQRSLSFDRPAILKANNLTHRYDMNVNLKNNSSIEKDLQTGIIYRYTTAMTGHTVDRKGLNATDTLISESRRCSVPALLSSQKQKIVTTSKICDMSRRTSIAYGSNTGVNSLGGSTENVDLQFSESKRRVRMINRH